MRIKKVDSIAKMSLRVFATFNGEARLLPAVGCVPGSRLVCRGNGVVALRTSATLHRRDCCNCCCLDRGVAESCFGDQKKATTFLSWLSS